MRYLLFSIRPFLLLITLALGVGGLQAKEYEGKSTKPVVKPNTAALNKMMDCNPPIAYTEFALNNVRFGLEAGGQIWENNGDASYEIPKIDPGSNEASIHSLYAGALWVGGYSPDGQLKLAAVTYRTGGGTDFYNGPLSNNSFATADYCNMPGYSDFDDHFFANRTDVLIHRSYHQSLIDGTTEELFPDGYTMPDYFNDWPGYNEDPNYAQYLAPYWDFDGNGFYEPELGDYPWYDLDNAIDCRTRAVTDPIPLFGDETMWWVFNDNGGLHTETGGQQIGMEIQAQAFAYTETNEINDMTFYNYVLINRGVQTLQDCYFGQWVDPDLGCPTDDYVGCDVQRGLSFTYNGTENDAACDGVPGYDQLPPAVGVDFFEGPFQDPDGINNPLTTDLQLVNDQAGIPYAGIGIGYEDLSLDVNDPRRDNVIDNERFGMRRFVYYNRDDQTPTPNINGEPDIAIEFYSYLNGVWKNGEQMTYGGNGVGGSTPTDFMFPDLSDPVGFATNGAIVDDQWTEGGEDNQPGDRRFIQSAGTFQLDPGEFNNITVGVVWARPFGGEEQTLNALRIADDKAQSLFDNCFRILSGPDAPELTAQELENQVILYIENNNPSSNNYLESYGFPSDFAFDPLIPDLLDDGTQIPLEDKYYEFQGYNIYQLRDETVSAAELGNPDRARLAFQTDKQDGISQIINFEPDPALGLLVPRERVNGSDQGIQHSVVLSEDLFSTDGSGLVNFKKYYYMAVAYAHNEYDEYNQGTGSGQSLPYLESRKSATGGIPIITVIPHDPSLENGGTVATGSYGDVVAVKRIEGKGNGGNIVDITTETRQNIVNAEYGMANELDYKPNASPIQIKVVDPLKVDAANFRFGMMPVSGNEVDDVVDDYELDDPDKIGWFLIDQAYPNDTIFSYNTIDLGGEQLILDYPRDGSFVDYGISIDVSQYEYEDVEDSNNKIPAFLEGTIEYDDVNATPWLSGVPDGDLNTEQNWIRAGTNTTTSDTAPPDDPQGEAYYLDKSNIDPTEIYEGVLGGTVSPWHLVAQSWSGPANSDEDFQGTASTRITDLNNVDIRFTSNKDEWTRVAVLEISQFREEAFGGAEKTFARIALSLDKNGRNQLNGGNVNECTSNGRQALTQEDIDDLSSADVDRYLNAAYPGNGDVTESDLLGLSFGMSWFPGYAIDVESGERLNMAFGENSKLAAENGADMVWNPTSRLYNEFQPVPFDPNNARFGGMHYFYVFRNQSREQFGNPTIRMPQYDRANFIYDNINSGSNRRRVFRACTWVGLPLAEEGVELLSMEDGIVPADVTMRLRIAKPYERMPTIADFYTDYLDANDDFPYFFWDDESGILQAEDFNAGDMVTDPTVPALDYADNSWLPLYEFSTGDFATQTNVQAQLTMALEGDAINVVPNPYYGRAEIYENGRLNTEVKIVNVPADNRVVVRIYDTSGNLVRTLVKDPSASGFTGSSDIAWDLKNERNVPIASGVHIFHIDVEGVGEKVVKWFGVMRPVDLDNF